MVNQRGAVEEPGLLEELGVLEELEVLPTRVTAWCNSQAESVHRMEQLSRELRHDVICKQNFCSKRQFSRDLRHGVVNPK